MVNSSKVSNSSRIFLLKDSTDAFYQEVSGSINAGPASASVHPSRNAWVVNSVPLSILMHVVVP